jgi:hypothetical protein
VPVLILYVFVMLFVCQEGSRASRDPLFCFFRNAEHFFPDDALRGFIQIIIESTLDFEKLWPKSFVDERNRSAQNHGGVALSRVPVRSEAVTTA